MDDFGGRGRTYERPRSISLRAIEREAYLREIRRAQNSWQFSGEDYLASDESLDELRATAAELGVIGVRVLDGQLRSYPHIVRVEARELTLRIGKKKDARLRPSHVATMLKAA